MFIDKSYKINKILMELRKAVKIIAQLVKLTEHTVAIVDNL